MGCADSRDDLKRLGTKDKTEDLDDPADPLDHEGTVDKQESLQTGNSLKDEKTQVGYKVEDNVRDLDLMANLAKNWKSLHKVPSTQKVDQRAMPLYEDEGGSEALEGSGEEGEEGDEEGEEGEEGEEDHEEQGDEAAEGEEDPEGGTEQIDEGDEYAEEEPEEDEDEDAGNHSEASSEHAQPKKKIPPIKFSTPITKNK